MTKKLVILLSLCALTLSACKDAKRLPPSDKQATKLQAPSGQRHTVEGLLGESDLFSGQLGQPKRYILRDPQTRAIRAYVQISPKQDALDRAVGTIVRVSGRCSQEDATGLLIQAEAVIVIGSRFSAPPAAKPAEPPTESDERKAIEEL